MGFARTKKVILAKGKDSIGGRREARGSPTCSKLRRKVNTENHKGTSMGKDPQFQQNREVVGTPT